MNVYFIYYFLPLVRDVVVVCGGVSGWTTCEVVLVNESIVVPGCVRTSFESRVSWQGWREVPSSPRDRTSRWRHTAIPDPL